MLGPINAGFREEVGGDGDAGGVEIFEVGVVVRNLFCRSRKRGEIADLGVDVAVKAFEAGFAQVIVDGICADEEVGLF